jgi:tRNA threonylcarbamoyladenosine biosynthesis protein TsaB
MRVLALDTTTRAGSAALVDNGRVVEERTGDASRPHGERLPGELIDLLASHGLAIADVDLFAVASGPGSFTGLRIGIATIQGLAFVGPRPVVAVSALEALAELGSVGGKPGDLVGAWMDAHRREVFSALYRIGEAGRFEKDRLVEIDGPAVGDPAETIERWRAHLPGAELAMIGDGASLYLPALSRVPGPPPRVLPPPPLAGAIGRMAVDRARRGQTVVAAGIQPLYVRRPDAEVARDAAAGRTGRDRTREGQG